MCYLFKKCIERSHMPARLWEKVKLRGPTEYVTAKIAKELEFMPEFLVTKCQARYVRLQECLRRTERLKNDPSQPVLSIKHTKVIRREQKREARSKKVALIENAIERELLERLQKGVYGDIYNLPQATFENALTKHGRPDVMQEDDEEEEDVEFVDGELDEEEYTDDDDAVEYLDEFDGESGEEEAVSDVEDFTLASQNGKSRRPRVEVEYEGETVVGGGQKAALLLSRRGGGGEGSNSRAL